MKTAGKREVRENFSAYLEEAQEEPIVVLDRGRPCAVIKGVAGQKLEEIIRDDPSKKKGRR